MDASRAGGSVVEYTGGSTGVSLALVCAVKGYPLHIVTSDAFAKEKLDYMRILGATLQIVPSDSGRMTEQLTRDMIEAARVVAADTGAFWTDQMKNRDQMARLSRDGGGDLDADRRADRWLRPERGHRRLASWHGGRRCAATTGRSGSWRWSPLNLRCSRVASRARIEIDGIGAGFVVPLWREGIADHIERVSTEDAMAMALRLAREEGLFAGTSTGANVIAALRLAERLEPGATIATVMCDTGMKYLKTFGVPTGPVTDVSVTSRRGR